MSLIIGFAILVCALAACVLSGSDMLYGLLIGMGVFYVLARRQGRSPKEVLRMMFSGVRESFVVVITTFLIGALTGIWRGSGTIPWLVINGARLIHPRLFILFSFLLPAVVSSLIGTSFGTCATSGIILMTLCHVSGGNPLLTGAAILSGIFVGDRSSTASSCAALNAHLTHTEIYSNVRAMNRDALPALLITLGLYGVLSFFFPLQSVDTGILDRMQAQFRFSFLLLIPIVIILAAPALKLKIRTAMLLSILSASVLALRQQGMSIPEVLRTLVLGYQARGEFADLLSGGGLRSMFHSNLMIVVSATYSGIFNGTHMLDVLEKPLEKLADKFSVFRMTLWTGIPLIMVSCTQTLALMLEAPLIRPVYEKRGLSNERMMLDLADSTVLISGLVPWSLAGSMPREMLGLPASGLPLAFYLYLPAIITIARERKRKKA